MLDYDQRTIWGDPTFHNTGDPVWKTGLCFQSEFSIVAHFPLCSLLDSCYTNRCKWSQFAQYFMKLLPDLQSLWVSLRGIRVWIKSLHLQSKHSHNSQSPASNKPAPLLTMGRERERERGRNIEGKEREQRKGWTSGWQCTAAFFHLHLLQPSKKREGEKEMDLTTADHHAAATSTCPGGLGPTSVCKTPVAFPSIFLLHPWFLISFSVWRSSFAWPDVWSTQWDKLLKVLDSTLSGYLMKIRQVFQQADKDLLHNLNCYFWTVVTVKSDWKIFLFNSNQHWGPDIHVSSQTSGYSSLQYRILA